MEWHTLCVVMDVLIPLLFLGCVGNSVCAIVMIKKGGNLILGQLMMCLTVSNLLLLLTNLVGTAVAAVCAHAQSQCYGSINLLHIALSGALELAMCFLTIVIVADRLWLHKYYGNGPGAWKVTLGLVASCYVAGSMYIPTLISVTKFCTGDWTTWTVPIPRVTYGIVSVTCLAVIIKWARNTRRSVHPEGVSKNEPHLQVIYKAVAGFQMPTVVTTIMWTLWLILWNGVGSGIQRDIFLFMSTIPAALKPMILILSNENFRTYCWQVMLCKEGHLTPPSRGFWASPRNFTPRDGCPTNIDIVASIEIDTVCNVGIGNALQDNMMSMPSCDATNEVTDGTTEVVNIQEQVPTKTVQMNNWVGGNTATRETKRIRINVTSSPDSTCRVKVNNKSRNANKSMEEIPKLRTTSLRPMSCSGQSRKVQLRLSHKSHSTSCPELLSIGMTCMPVSPGMHQKAEKVFLTCKASTASSCASVNVRLNATHADSSSCPETECYGCGGIFQKDPGEQGRHRNCTAPSNKATTGLNYIASIPGGIMSSPEQPVRRKMRVRRMQSKRRMDNYVSFSSGDDSPSPYITHRRRRLKKYGHSAK